MGRRILPAIVFTIAAMPVATCSGVLLPALFVPIMITNALGDTPSISPFCSRHSTFSVRSWLMPKLPGFHPPKAVSQVFLPCHMSVMESPTKYILIPPFLASATYCSWRWKTAAPGWITG